MTFSHRAPSRMNGNAFIYILISVILLSGLSFALSRSNDSNPTSEISEASAKAAATAILSYESQARAAVDQMIQTGTNVENIDFMMPNNANFNVAPTITKLFHPDGGGLQYKTAPSSYLKAGANGGYYVGKFNNIEWTPTSAQDVIFTAYRIRKEVCQQLNKIITGSTTVPVRSGGAQPANFVPFVISGIANQDFPASQCGTCNGKPSFCVSDGVLTNSTSIQVYYSVLYSR